MLFLVPPLLAQGFYKAVIFSTFKKTKEIMEDRNVSGKYANIYISGMLFLPLERKIN